MTRPEYMGPCPICGTEVDRQGARGKPAVCDACELRMTDESGRPVEVKEFFRRENEAIYYDGPVVVYREPDPQAGEVCSRANGANAVYIDGTKCELFEGFAGWSGLIVRDPNEFVPEFMKRKPPLSEEL